MVTNSSEPAQSNLEPSSSLHTKLQTILHAYGAAARLNNNTALYDLEIEAPSISHILQAFQEEGWLSPDGKEKLIALTRHVEQQGFLDRFKAELDKLNPSMRLEAWNLVLEAASLAAGTA